MSYKPSQRTSIPIDSDYTNRDENFYGETKLIVSLHLQYSYLTNCKVLF